MPVEIKRKRPASFGIKVAIAIIVAFFVLGALLRLTGKTSLNPSNLSSSGLRISGNVFVPIIKLPVNIDAHEKEWTHALANKINGQAEVKIDRGQIDVVTDAYAIEIDFFNKWKEGLGQAIYYGDKSKRIGVLALVIKSKEHQRNIQELELLREIERLCIKKGVKLILLKSVNKNS